MNSDNHTLYVRKIFFSSVQSLSHVRLFAIPWTSAHQASVSITNSQSPSKLMSIELVMPSNHLIFCRPLLLLPSIFPRIRVFSNEWALHIRWPKYWSFSFNIRPTNEHPGLIFLNNKFMLNYPTINQRIDWGFFCTCFCFFFSPESSPLDEYILKLMTVQSII